MRPNSNVWTSKGEMIVRFYSYSLKKSKTVTLHFLSLKAMLNEFHKAWKKAQEEKLYFYELERYCVDNSVYRDPYATNWFFQERKVCDQRENNTINRSHIFGIKLILDQYIFEKEGE